MKNHIQIAVALAVALAVVFSPARAERMVKETDLITIRIDNQGRLWWHLRLMTPDNLPQLLPGDENSPDIATYKADTVRLFDLLLEANRRNSQLLTRVLVDPEAHYAWLDQVFRVFDRVEQAINAEIARSSGAKANDPDHAGRFVYRAYVRPWNARDKRMFEHLIEKMGALTVAPQPVARRDTFASRRRFGRWANREAWFEPLAIEPSIIVLQRAAVLPGETAADSDGGYPEVLPSFLYVSEPDVVGRPEIDSLERGVAITALISDRGEPLQVALAQSSGDAGYDSLAIGAAWKCRFVPAIRHGRPVAAWISFTYRRP